MITFSLVHARCASVRSVQFLKINIFQRSARTSTCGWIFNDPFVANFLMTLPVTKSGLPRHPNWAGNTRSLTSSPAHRAMNVSRNNIIITVRVV